MKDEHIKGDNTMTYNEFIASKEIRHVDSGFDVEIKDLNSKLFDWQKLSGTERRSR